MRFSYRHYLLFHLRSQRESEQRNTAGRSRGTYYEVVVPLYLIPSCFLIWNLGKPTIREKSWPTISAGYRQHEVLAEDAREMLAATRVVVMLLSSPFAVYGVFIRNTCSPKQLPSRLIVGYANWNQCDESLVQAVRDGVNVLIWFSINLATVMSEGGDRVPSIENGPDMKCVAATISAINQIDSGVIHLISIGGWNSPHPDTRVTPESMFHAWNTWNRETISDEDLGFYGFDGFDWDIEGNDSIESPYNHFTCECLNFMGKFSELAKLQGYIVAMAPAESYLDPFTHSFDRSLLHTYPECRVTPPFTYHGLNVYAYLLSKYGKTAVNEQAVDTFDFVTVQLYEGYSHANYHIELQKESPVKYLVAFVERISKGWRVDFSDDRELNYESSFVSVPPERLVIGLANGWAGDGKFLLIFPEEIGEAYHAMMKSGITPRGFAFWNILDEGKESIKHAGRPVWMAKGLNDFLKIR